MKLRISIFLDGLILLLILLQFDLLSILLVLLSLFFSFSFFFPLSIQMILQFFSVIFRNFDGLFNINDVFFFFWVAIFKVYNSHDCCLRFPTVLIQLFFEWNFLECFGSKIFPIFIDLLNRTIDFLFLKRAEFVFVENTGRRNEYL